MSNAEHNYDVLIIGTGAAGLTLALHLPADTRIAILSKGEVHDSSTLYAQGGISAVLGREDSVAAHTEDTLVAGAGNDAMDGGAGVDSCKGGPGNDSDLNCEAGDPAVALGGPSS